MRPFRFFFALSLGLFFLFFVAKFVIMALVVAAVLSTAFFVFRRVRYFLLGMTWEDHRYRYHNHFHTPRGLPEWHYEEEPLFSRKEKQTEWLTDYRSIEVQ